MRRKRISAGDLEITGNVISDPGVTLLTNNRKSDCESVILISLMSVREESETSTKEQEERHT